MFLAHCPQKHGVPVIVQEALLAFAKWADVDSAVGLYAHFVERGSVGDRGDNQPTVVLEANEPPVEKMVDTRRQQQSILPIQTFLVI